MKKIRNILIQDAKEYGDLIRIDDNPISFKLVKKLFS